MIQLPAHPSDHIADLLDRHGCLHTLVAHWDEHARTGIQLAVIWLNIDRFKQINDSFGHRVGDQVLGILAARVAEALAGRGQVARVGGDEFAVILPNCPRVAGERLARALLSAIGQPLAVDGVRVRPSASLGLGLANPGESPHDLLERTERAMHLAKRQGGAQYCLSVAPEPSHEQEKRQARNELAMEETLHRALETGGLFLKEALIYSLI